MEDKLEAYIVFIDYSKAFDCVSHKELFNKMINMGFPGHLVYLIKDLYTAKTKYLKIGTIENNPILIESKDLEEVDYEIFRFP